MSKVMDHDDDPDTRRLHNQLEHEIANINRKHIGEVAGAISKQHFIDVAEKVSVLRAHYLKQVLEFGRVEAGLDEAKANELRQLRQNYQEAMEGFNALQHAFRRGYLTLG